MRLLIAEQQIPATFVPSPTIHCRAYCAELVFELLRQSIMQMYHQCCVQYVTLLRLKSTRPFFVCVARQSLPCSLQSDGDSATWFELSSMALELLLTFSRATPQRMPQIEITMLVWKQTKVTFACLCPGRVKTCSIVELTSELRQRHHFAFGYRQGENE